MYTTGFQFEIVKVSIFKERWAIYANLKPDEKQPLLNDWPVRQPANETKDYALARQTYLQCIMIDDSFVSSSALVMAFRLVTVQLKVSLLLLSLLLLGFAIGLLILPRMYSFIRA